MMHICGQVPEAFASATVFVLKYRRSFVHHDLQAYSLSVSANQFSLQYQNVVI